MDEAVGAEQVELQVEVQVSFQTLSFGVNGSNQYFNIVIIRQGKSRLKNCF